MEINFVDQEGNLIKLPIDRSLTIVGANGSGKTRLSVWVEENNSDIKVHRISAQKTLIMPEEVFFGNYEKAQIKFLYGFDVPDPKNPRELRIYKALNRWGGKPVTHQLNDFESLNKVLFADYYECLGLWKRSVDAGQIYSGPEAKLEIISNIWPELLPQTSLSFNSGSIQVTRVDKTGYYRPNNLEYNASEMSDGEREVFYLLGQALSMPEGTLVIIDEPEIHLHPSITNPLWNRIELLRSDCTFIYITHDFEFLKSRENTTIVWVKDYLGKNKWNYEIIDRGAIPEELLINILGSRRDILFVESINGKYDKRICTALFPKMTIIEAGGKEEVIRKTRTARSLSNLHRVEAKGVIDRDRDSDEQVEIYRSEGIYCLSVAEIENLLLAPEVLDIVLESLSYSTDKVKESVDRVKSGVFVFLKNKLEEQALKFTKEDLNRKVGEQINKRCQNYSDYRQGLSTLDLAKVSEEFQETNVTLLQDILEAKDYFGALRVINHKGLFNDSGVLKIVGLDMEKYIEHVIRLLNNPSHQESLRSEMVKYFGFE